MLWIMYWIGLTVLGMPSDRVQVCVAVMEQELVVGAVHPPLKEIHEVMTVYHPAQRRTGSGLYHTWDYSLL